MTLSSIMTFLSRRRLLAGGLGMFGGAVVVGGGYVLVEAGIAPGKYRLAQIMGACGNDPGLPKVTAGPVLATRFMSRYRRRNVEMFVMRPPGRHEVLPAAIVLHGAGDDAASAIQLGFPEFLAAALAHGGMPPFALMATTHWAWSSTKCYPALENRATGSAG
jgi:hypothetical protein